MDMNIVTFLKTQEVFGGLSNMAGGFLLLINGHRILTSEHLYQALKFPDAPEIQRRILDQPSPMTAKMVARKKEYRKFMRADWQSIQVEVMEFCLRAKLIWNWVAFGNLLRSTADRAIFEISSKKDRFWGVVETAGELVGENHLGRLLDGLRDHLVSPDNEALRVLEAPPHLGLRLLGNPIEKIDRRGHLLQVGTRSSEWVAAVRP